MQLKNSMPYDLSPTPPILPQLTVHKGAVIWLTALSGAGKTTLAKLLHADLLALERKSITLDGDELRKGLCSDLGFDETGRTENIRRTAEVAKLLAQNELIAICSLISPFERDRAQVRFSCHRDNICFSEVFISAPLELCEKRDPKGLYVRARNGEISNFTGINSSYEAPQEPDLILQTDIHSASKCCAELLNHVVLKTNITG
ncbi:MAG: adenylyl-sulfate kinase [Prosthecobacter sp.]|nr:adenylyl-sulfate kinase [Prosthecobacter sp.]